MPKYSRFFVFNPENEMAIADGSPYYTPPATILKMAEDLSYLPAYYAGDRDVVWVKEMPDRKFLEERKTWFRLAPSLVTGENQDSWEAEEFALGDGVPGCTFYCGKGSGENGKKN